MGRRRLKRQVFRRVNVRRRQYVRPRRRYKTKSRRQWRKRSRGYRYRGTRRYDKIQRVVFRDSDNFKFCLDRDFQAIKALKLTTCCRN